MNVHRNYYQLLPMILFIYTGIMVFCFPGYMFGRSAKSVGDSACACACALCCFICPFHCLLARTLIRGKIREKQGIIVIMHACMQDYLNSTDDYGLYHRTCFKCIIKFNDAFYVIIKPNCASDFNNYCGRPHAYCIHYTIQ